MKSLKWRAVLYSAFLIGCVWAIWPPFGSNGKAGKLRLGLDLRGGTHLVLQVLPEQSPDGQPRRVSPQTLDEVVRTLDRRVNQLGVADSVVTSYGHTGDRVLVQLPGLDDAEHAKRLIVSVAQLSLHLVERAAPTREALLGSPLDGAPPSLMVLQGRGNAADTPVFYLVRREAVVTGRDLKGAYPGRGDLGQPVVHFSLKPPGAEALQRATARNVGRQLAIVLDERVVSAPRIDGVVGAEGQIRGSFTPAEAEDMAALLRAGALPAKLRYVEELTVGASLGRDSIRAGLVASGVALCLIAAFMVAYYRLAGVNAVVALVVNLLVLLTAMALLRAPLTLPGIAGIILTLGLGVDTNVLVFERIREELRSGETPFGAIHAGFARVWVTILDTHATALIASAVLFQFGTGPIKGFAVTLAIGLVANVFASYFVSKALFEWTLARRPATAPSI
ncbi:MAG: protein translocase subunit SecD [Vicinamibacteria bacterium]